MSDLRLFNLKKGHIESKTLLEKSALKSIVCEHLEPLLGIKLIENDFALNDNEKIETLGYDENFRLVILEYRTGKFSGVVSKGLVFIDYIINNQGKIKSLLSEKLGYEFVKQLNFSPRLLIIGEDFNKYDEYAIKQMPYIVELIKYQLFEKQYLVLEKIFQSKKSYGEKAVISNGVITQISDFVLSLGDEVCEEKTAQFICYRKIRAFAYLFEQDELMINILQNGKYKAYKLANPKDLSKVEDLLEQSYDEQ